MNVRTNLVGRLRLIRRTEWAFSRAAPPHGKCDERARYGECGSERRRGGRNAELVVRPRADSTRRRVYRRKARSGDACGLLDIAVRM